MLPRSGGTVISRCIGCMEDVYYLSEVHPRSNPDLKMLDPIWQAQSWFGFFSDFLDAPRLFARESFLQKIAAIYEEVAKRNGTLVVRDWSHLDFTAFPHVRDPRFCFSTTMTLSEQFDIRAIALVRHPKPQFRSHWRLLTDGIANERVALVDKFFSPELFAKAYFLYAKQALNLQVFRYEDFVLDPDSFLISLCKALDISFDSGYRDRWRDYDTLTGAVEERTDGIAIVERAPLPSELESRLVNNELYRTACNLLGYS